LGLSTSAVKRCLQELGLFIKFIFFTYNICKLPKYLVYDYFDKKRSVINIYFLCVSIIQNYHPII